ncbi:unnamed protein product [Urochloa humidicola]
MARTRGGGSESAAGRRRQRQSSENRPAATRITRSRAAQSEQSPSPQLGKRRRSRPRTTDERQEDEKSVKRTKKGTQEDSAAESSDPAAAEQVSNTASQEDAEAASTSAAAEQVTSDEASSTFSSPLRCPFIPEVKNSDGKEIYDPEIDTAYFEEEDKYCAKLARYKKLLTLDHRVPSSCLDDPILLPIRESATKIVRQTGKVVLGLSSYIDGKLLARCSGFLIDWDKENNRGTILTSAHLICTKFPRVDLWSGTQEYAPNAKVQVHLLDDTTVDGRLLHYHKHYHIALFEVDLNLSTELPVTSEFLSYGQEVFLLGRDENLDLITSHSRVKYMDPGLYDHYHFIYVNCGVAKFGAGGPAIDFNGRIVGMANPTPRAAFIPMSVVLRCLRMWKDFECAPRLHLGLKLSAIKFLDDCHAERLSRKFNIDSGLIVKEVQEGSIAEKIGIKMGDIIESWNGEHVSTTVDLEIMMLHTCEEHLRKGNALGSNADVSVVVFDIRKRSRHTKKLTLIVCDEVEVIARGTYAVSAKERSRSDVDVNQGREIPHGTGDGGAGG